MPPLSIEEYQVGWICALPKELTAARAMLDEEHELYTSQVPYDNNSYQLGRIHGHNVVMACLPAGVYGTVSAATVAANMLRTFIGIRFGLMVGIGGGIPSSHKYGDIRLGDVVVSQPDGTHGGVVQYDFRKNLGDGIFERKGVLRPPPTLLLTALANLQSRHQMYGNQILKTVSAMIQRFPSLAEEGFVHPGQEKDTLFCGNVESHKRGDQCSQCRDGIVQRLVRKTQSPKVHYGVIASGNELMKNVVERDRLGRELGAKCVEMEAAGLMDHFPCIVVRGICDYADSHKNDVWQEYAAVTAAGFAKELLATVKPIEVMSVKKASEVMKYNLGLSLYDAPDMAEDLFIGRQTEIQQMESILKPQSDTVGSCVKVLILGGLGGIVFWLNATSEVSLRTSLRNEDDRLRVLATRSGRDNVESDPDARRLANRFGGLPLALATAGAFLSQSSVSFGQYLRQYNARWKVINSMEELTDYPSRTLYTTWTLSFTLIEQQSPRAAQLLRFLAYLDHQDIWFQLLEKGQGYNQPAWFTEIAGDEFVFEDVMRVLTRHCLVEAQYRIGSYSLHMCVHDWTLDGLNQQIDARRYWLAFDCVAGHIGADDWDHLSAIRYQRFTRHAMRLVHSRFRIAATQRKSVRPRLGAMVTLAELLKHQVQYNAAEQMYLRALRGIEETFGPAHISTLSTLNNLGLLNAHQGKLAEAEKMLLRAMQGRKKALGTKHTPTLETINNLGNLYRDQDKLAEAEKMYLWALQGKEKTLGPIHISTFSTVNNLGNLYMDQGKLAEAEEMYLRAMQGREKVLGAKHTSTLETINNLGSLYVRQGKLNQAEEMYLQAQKGYEEALGLDHVSTLGTVCNMGVLYALQDKLAEAEKMCLRALRGYEEALGAERLPLHLPALSSIEYSSDGHANAPSAIRYCGLVIRKGQFVFVKNDSPEDWIARVEKFHRKQRKLYVR
ncbi:Tetratricopeptide repeat-containing protein [Cladophialophora immunda]|nr:Tetratricopeptide repeat-containing protein [Cladophialophora immunda]